jgi:membrane protein implicated in regulation of membrane protease activity
MEFEIWHYWLVASILFFIFEMVVPSFVVFNFGIGSLFGCLAATTNLSLEWQLAFFSLATISSFFLIRPAVKKWAYKRSQKIKTNIEAIIGRVGIVSETIDPLAGKGRVKLDGDDWMARTESSVVIPVDTRVTITGIDSIVLTVEKINQ